MINPKGTPWFAKRTINIHVATDQHFSFEKTCITDLTVISTCQPTNLSITHKLQLSWNCEFYIRKVPKHVQELLGLSVWELRKRILRPKLGWIVSLLGASLGMCDWR